MTNQEISNIAKNGILGYIVRYMDIDQIEDPILKEKWKQAQVLLREIESMLPDPYDENEPDNDEEFGLRRFGS